MKKTSEFFLWTLRQLLSMHQTITAIFHCSNNVSQLMILNCMYNYRIYQNHLMNESNCLQFIISLPTYKSNDPIIDIKPSIELHEIEQQPLNSNYKFIICSSFLFFVSLLFLFHSDNSFPHLWPTNVIFFERIFFLN